MKNYNFEYTFKGKYKKYETSAKCRKPIEINIDNKQYKQEQTEFLRELFPNGLNKQNKQQIELLRELFPNGLNKQINVM